MYFLEHISGTFIQIGLTACWLIGPFLYFYTKHATSQKELKSRSWKYHLLVLIPIALFVNIRNPWYENYQVWQDYIIPGIYRQWFLYVILSGFLLWQLFRKNNKSVVRNGSFRLWILSIYFGNLLIWAAFSFAKYGSYIFGALTFSVIFYLLLLLILLSKKRKSLLLLKPPKYGDVKIQDLESKKVIESLQMLMSQEKLFKNPNLSLKDVANAIGIQPNKLSQIINEGMGQNFAVLLGTYRIEEAKKLMLEKSNYSIEGIGYECGFNSKSAFYSVFKKRVGMTPSKFKSSAIS